MKKVLIKAFTLVELIVVISIMTLITTSTVFYFVDFVKNKELTQKIKIIENQLIDLDKDIKNYKIYDYEINLNINTLSWWYITYLNNFDIDYKQTISLNTSNWSWTISISWTATSWTWLLKLYKKQKLFFTKEISNTSSFDFLFNTVENYKIASTLSWEILNNININYFTKDNLYPERNNNINLIKINTKEDKTWTAISELIITNVWWNKKITDWTSEYDDIFLFFENNWVEKFIKITK